MNSSAQQRYACLVALRKLAWLTVLHTPFRVFRAPFALFRDPVSPPLKRLLSTWKSWRAIGRVRVSAAGFDPLLLHHNTKEKQDHAPSAPPTRCLSEAGHRTTTVGWARGRRQRSCRRGEGGQAWDDRPRGRGGRGYARGVGVATGGLWQAASKRARKMNRMNSFQFTRSARLSLAHQRAQRNAICVIWMPGGRPSTNFARLWVVRRLFRQSFCILSKNFN